MEMRRAYPSLTLSFHIRNKLMSVAVAGKPMRSTNTA